MKPTGHVHEFEIPDGFEYPGDRPVDNRLLESLIGAACDSCTTCQGSLLTALVEDPITTVRLVDMTCITVHVLSGGLPPMMTEPDAPGETSEEFRLLARAGLEPEGAHEAMFQACGRMNPAERRSAAKTALDILVDELIDDWSPLGSGTSSRRWAPFGLP